MKNYIQIPTKNWAWGPTTHWQLYFALKKIGKRFSSHVAKGLSDGSTSGISGTKCSTSLPVVVSKRQKSKSCFRCDSRSSVNTALYQEILCKEDANKLIWRNEETIDINKFNIDRCEINQLASNAPNEDHLFLTDSPLTEGVIFGVLDGHGGTAFGEYTKKRLPYYLHAALADRSALKNGESINKLVNSFLSNDIDIDILNWRKYLNKYIEELSSNVQDENAGNILSYVSNPLREIFPSKFSTSNLSFENIDIVESIRDAFLRLDADIIDEIKYLSRNKTLDTRKKGLTLSGCCGLVAYLNKDELYIANAGDCRAVLGTNTNGEWSAVPLSPDHTSAANTNEVQRILSEHPSEESRSCIQYGRLLGRLAPLRAFGDIQFKLSASESHSILSGHSKYKPMPMLKTPPYLTAEPDVFHYKLEANDEFIVLASDGLWDMLSNEDVVNIVAAYLEGNSVSLLKERAHMFGVANCDEIIANPQSFMDTADENVASFLIRFALGGYDELNLMSMLSLPHPEVRYYRDDISIMVIFLNRSSEEEKSASLVF